jgi:hypothetical protein
MRAYLRRACACVALSCAVAALLAACGDSTPIPRLVIPTRDAAASAPAPTAGASPLPTPPPTHPPVPLQCSPPSPEDANAPRGSALRVSGACAFTQTARVKCTTQPDDFIFSFSRNTPNGPTIYFQMNIEFYKGPGGYAQNVQMLFEIADNGTIYEWDAQSGAVTVDGGERSGSLHNVSLPADPGSPSRGMITVDGTFACA